MTDVDDNTSEKETRLETHLQTRLGSRVRQLRVLCRNDGVVLHGSAHLPCQATRLTFSHGNNRPAYPGKRDRGVLAARR